MDQRSLNIRQQIERCRRLASLTTDDEIRHSLEQLAEEYEAKLPRRSGAGFMLQPEDARRAADRSGR